MLRNICLTLALMAASLFTTAFAGAGPVSAQNLDEIVTVTVEPGWQTSDGTWMTALHFTLAPGWKTYWRAPGDAGIPPLFDWQADNNIAAVSVKWPVPVVFQQGGMRSIGYHDDLVLPIELWPRDGEVMPRLSGRVDIGVCQDICVPVHLEFDAPAGSDRTAARNPVIMAALIDQPLSASEARVGQVTCHVAIATRGMEVTAQIVMPPLGATEAVVIESGNPTHWVSEARTTREGDVLTATALVIPQRGGTMVIERSNIRFTVLANDRAVDIRGCQGR